MQIQTGPGPPQIQPRLRVHRPPALEVPEGYVRYRRLLLKAADDEISRTAEGRHSPIGNEEEGQSQGRGEARKAGVLGCPEAQNARAGVSAA